MNLLGGNMYLNILIAEKNGLHVLPRNWEIRELRTQWARHLAAQFRSKGM